MKALASKLEMEKTTITKGNLRWLWVSVVVVLLDQGTKLWVTQHLNLWESKPLMPFFNLTLRHNTGAAYSFLGQAGGWQQLVFIAIASIFSIIILAWLARMPRTDNWSAVAFALILGGALGNLWDRLALSYVIDFIDFYIKSWHLFGIFNIADVAISMGAVMLILGALFPQIQSSEK